MDNLDNESKILYTPYEKEDAYKSLSMPIYNTAAYEFNSAEDMEETFCGRSDDYAYSRLTNPTVQYFERRIMSLTGAKSVTALNSGMAAISNVLMSIAYNGCNIVTSPHLFGNTYSFFRNTLGAFGVETRFCDLTDTEEVKRNIDSDTCAIFLEVITNPQLEVADLKALAEIAHKAGVPLIADTTVVPPHLFHAHDFGVDIEVISSTKYISGGATSLGGLILDYCDFDWNKSKRLSEIAKTEGVNAFTYKLRHEIHRNLGAYMTPQVAYMQSLGLETLEVRYDRQASTCLELAKRLNGISQIKAVNYTSLDNNRFHEISIRQFGKYSGAVLTFDLESQEECYRFMNKLKVIRRATNLFDNKTLAIHPASTIFGTFSDDLKREMDVNPCTIRLSVGLEDADTLINDIIQALS